MMKYRFLYLCRINESIIKIGMTERPKDRMRALKHENKVKNVPQIICLLKLPRQCARCVEASLCGFSEYYSDKHFEFIVKQFGIINKMKDTFKCGQRFKKDRKGFKENACKKMHIEGLVWNMAFYDYSKNFDGTRVEYRDGRLNAF